MPAKKRTTDKKTVAELTELLELMTAQWKETKEQLAEAKELLKKGEETMREHAGGDVELMEALAAKNKELIAVTHARDEVTANFYRTLKQHGAHRREDRAEIEYWKGEVTRLHNDLIEIKREAAQGEAF